MPRSTFSGRSRLIEFHEQPFTPAPIRRAIQDCLALAWTLRFWPIQRSSPAEVAVEVLEEVVGRVGGKGKGKEEEMQIVDFCSGAGGPVPTIERIINSKRKASSLPPIPFLLSDLLPHPTAWRALAAASPSRSLAFVEGSVDATNAPREMVAAGLGLGGERERAASGQGKGKAEGKGKQMRTFFLAFHHFDDEGAVRVLADAMEKADAVGIFELQTFDAPSLLTITLLGLLPPLTVPFYLPFNALTWVFTYLIPIVPLVLVLDGYVSAYRTRSLEHVEHLAHRALLQLRADDKRPTGGAPWVWEQGSKLHTWPGGRMYYIVGRRADS